MSDFVRMEPLKDNFDYLDNYTDEVIKISKKIFFLLFLYLYLFINIFCYIFVITMKN